MKEIKNLTPTRLYTADYTTYKLCFEHLNECIRKSLYYKEIIEWLLFVNMFLKKGKMLEKHVVFYVRMKIQNIA